jgi:hypothetical protein
MFTGKSLTKADEARRDACKAGHCMACIQRRKNVMGQGLVEWHHLEGKKKHDKTIGLCIWHHRALLFWGHTHEDMRAEYGPSLADGSRPFHAAFGSDAELLELQNKYLNNEGEGA